ncbi:MAG: c-type cytochrome, partial [Deltaproteobacteria bacterium]|nr:c-type cytochrome [Deltaproteobacteria bacterium]
MNPFNRIRAIAFCCSPFFILLLTPFLFPSPLAHAERGAGEGRVGGTSTTEGLYLQHCSSCHHPERYGISASPLFKETIGGKKDSELKEIISKGLPATNMPLFGQVLSAEEIDGIVAYIKAPLEKPRWNKEDILKSKIVADNPPKAPLLKSPSFPPLKKGDEGGLERVDLSNLFMIVEGGTGTVHFMDGDTFTLLDKVKVGAIHGGPKYDYDLNFSYILSRDGWLVKYDLKGLKEVSRLRVGINSRNLAVSGDSRYLAIANRLPANIVFIDAVKLEPVHLIELDTLDTKVEAIYTLKKRGVFIIVLRDSPELWLVDYKNGFPIERLLVPQPLNDIFIEPGERFIIGAARSGNHLTVFDITERKVVKEIEVEAMPHLVSATIWKDEDRFLAAFPHIKSPILTVIELYTWDIIARVNLKGSGHFARTHPGNPYIWVDVHTDTVQLIDKKTLKVVKELIPEEGRFVMHTEFKKDGRYALVSVREKEVAVFIYD